MRLSLITNEHTIGPGFWKLNLSLLENEELIAKIKNKIKLIRATYAATPYSPDYIDSCPNKDIQLMISDSLFWESLLTQLRGVFIRFASIEKRKTCSIEKQLVKKIEKLEIESNLNKNNIQI